MEQTSTEDWKQMLKTEDLGYLGNIPIVSKNIVLFSGQSMAGKTASCLHIADSVIKGGKVVLYYDTETKSIIERAEPNLFKKLYSFNSKEYDKLFHYKKDLDNWAEDIRSLKPKLVIIDSLYIPFFNKYAEQRTRAKKIKEFLIEFRGVMWEMNMGAVITVPTGRVFDPNDKVVRNVPLGGEGVKYLADVKIMITSLVKENSDGEVGGCRFFVIDRNRQYVFEIGEGGVLKQTA